MISAAQPLLRRHHSTVSRFGRLTRTPPPPPGTNNLKKKDKTNTAPVQSLPTCRNDTLFFLFQRTLVHRPRPVSRCVDLRRTRHMDRYSTVGRRLKVTAISMQPLASPPTRRSRRRSLSRAQKQNQSGVLHQRYQQKRT